MVAQSFDILMQQIRRVTVIIAGNVQEEDVSKSTRLKTAMLLEQKIESKVQSEIEGSSDKSGSQGHWNWPSSSILE